MLLHLSSSVIAAMSYMLLLPHLELRMLFTEAVYYSLAVNSFSGMGCSLSQYVSVTFCHSAIGTFESFHF